MKKFFVSMLVVFVAAIELTIGDYIYKCGYFFNKLISKGRRYKMKIWKGVQLTGALMSCIGAIMFGLSNMYNGLPLTDWILTFELTDWNLLILVSGITLFMAGRIGNWWEQD